MDYQPPDFCIVSIAETDDPELFVIDLQSRWRKSPTYTVSQETIEFVVERVPICHPDYPNPPETAK